jgi:uncharacterized LabA/DUF88 family protein
VGKNVAVFVDVANIFYAAKAAGVDIDYVTLLKSATAGRDFVRAYAYTGLDPDNENQRNFHQFLARHQYKVVSKDIRKYGDGKVKANLDIELVVDLMKTSRNLDIAVIVSGDGDFASAIRAVQEMGVRCEVISFRGNTSSDLIEVADLFTDITQIAKVDKGSTRSGRRVAEDDDEDLSMTEVPEKQSEGTGRGRGRGRGRGGRYERDEAPVAARATRAPAYPAAAASAAGGGGALIALPGEKLSRAAATLDVGDSQDVELEDRAVDGESPEDAEGRRRRRRRGGRGRGRGRRDELGAVETVDGEVPEGVEPVADADLEADDEDAAEGEAVAAASVAPAPPSTRGGTRAGRTASGEFATPFDDLDALAAPRTPRSTPFGSVWDQQLGAPARPAASGLAPLPEDDEDLEEPEIPEYLLAERRQGGGNRGGANRGGRGGGRQSAYAAAIERERYGGGRGAGPSINRYGETRGGGSSRGGAPTSGGNRGGQGGGQGGGQAGRGGRNDRPAERFDRAPRPASTNAEPWSEVPPELEELLRSQMARTTPAAAPAARAPESPPAEAPKRRTPRTRAAAPADVSEAALATADTAADASVAPEPQAPKRRTTRSKEAAPVAEASTDVGTETAAAPKRRTTRAKATPAETATDAPVADAATAEAPAAPKRRTTTRKAAPDAGAAGTDAGTDAPVAEAAPAPKRRATTRRKASDADASEG